MHRWSFPVSGLAALLALLSGCVSESPVAPEEPTAEAEQVEAQSKTQLSQVLPDEYIVVFRDSVKNVPGRALGLERQHGLEVRHTYQHALKGFSARIPPQAVQAIENNPRVLFVEPNAVFQLDERPSPVLPPVVDVPVLGLRVRLVADDLSGAVDGSVVGTWPNRGSEVSADQGSGSKQPTFHAGGGAGFSGHAAVGFNEGVDDDEVLEILGVGGHGSGTLIAVLRQEDVSSHNYGIFAPYGSSRNRVGFVTYRAAGAHPISYWDKTNGWKDATATIGAGEEHVVVWRVAGGTAADFQVDGSDAGSVSISSGMHEPFDRYLVGATQPKTNTRFDGQVAELLFWDRALEDCERDQVVADLGGQYGIAVSVTGGPCDPPAPPADPAGLSATAIDHVRIDLAWTAGSSDEDGFKVERRLGQTGTWAEIAQVGAGVTAYTNNTGLSAETEYCYQVRAYNGNGDSGYTLVSCATTLVAPPLPPAVDVPLLGLRVRLVADDLSGSTGNGGDVGSWPNRGSDGDAAQGNAAQLPSFRAGGGAEFSGHSRVGFNEGADDDEVLEISGVSAHESATLVAVLKQEDVQGHNYGIFGMYTSPADRAGFVTYRSAGAHPISYWDPTNGWKDATVTIGAGEEHVVVWRLAGGTTADFQVDGSDAGSVSISSGIHQPFDRYLVGMTEPSTSTRFDGEVAELILYDRALLDCERDQVVADLGGQYGIAVSVTGGPCDPPAPPADPAGLSATAIDYRQIDLAWTAGSSDEDGFKVERRLGQTGTWAEIAQVGAGVTAYTNNTGLSAETEYCYQVRAYNGNGDSGYTLVSCATTLVAPGPPNPPTDLSATAIDHVQIDLAWTDASNDEDGFKVERRLGQTGTWAEIAQVGPDVTAYSSTGLNSDTEYCYQVRAYSSVGDSDYATTSCATTQSSPPAPPVVDVPVLGLRVRLVADDLSGAVDGSVVGTWPNRGSEVSADQGSGSKQPTFHAGGGAGFSGHAAVGFNEGVDDDEVLEILGVGGHGSGTLIAVLRQEDVSSHNYGIFAPYGSSRNRVGFVTYRAAGAHPISYWDKTNGWKDATATIGAGEEHVVVWRVAGGTAADFQVDGSDAGSVSISSGMHEPFDRYLVGATQPKTNTRFDGQVAELLFWDRALEDCERDQVVADLGGQYGIAVSVTGGPCDPPAPPADPAGLSATAIDHVRIDLAWTAGSSDEDGFKVERRLGQTGTWAEIAQVGAGVTAYTNNTGLSAETEYCYQVRAYNGNGDSGYTLVSCATTLVAPPLPPAVDVPLLGLRVRLVADDLSGSTGNGGDVGSWPNRGSDGDAAQGNAAQLPSFRAGGGAEFSGHSRVGFNEGADDDEVLEISGVSAHESATLVAVLKQEDVQGHNYGIFGMYTSPADRAGFVTYRSAGAHPISYWDPTNGWKDATVTIGAGEEHVVVWRLAGGTTADFQVDGSDAGSVSISSGIHQPFDRYLVGMTEPSTSTRFDGEVAELILYDRALLDCERDQVVADLGGQYGIAVSVTGSECVPPADPAGLSATAIDYRQIDLAWTAGSSDEDGFKVERRLGQTGTWAEIADVAAGVTTFPDEGLIPETEYCYRVYAYNGDGPSGPSNDTCTTTLVAPPGACVDVGTHDDLTQLWNITMIGADRNEHWKATQLPGCEIVPWYFGLDSGVDSDHPDLNVAEVRNFIAAEPTGTGEDGHGHGTHTAGSAAAIDGNGGVVGVAPGAPVYGFRVCGDNGSCEVADIVAGLDEVTARKEANPSQPMVGNMSLGGDFSAAMELALRRSSNAGVIYAVASGNGLIGACIFAANSANLSPAGVGDDDINESHGSDGNTLRVNGVITTTSSTETDGDANCNYGNPVTVAAPGTNIKSTHLNGGYSTSSGTSMATPHVAGAALLYLQGNPAATPIEVEAAIVSDLAPWSSNNQPNASGRLNVEDLR